MTKRARILAAAVIGLVLGAAVGWLIGWLARSDNAPFCVALGALAGLWGRLTCAKVVRPLVLGVLGLLSLALLVFVFTPPRAPIHTPAPPTTAVASPAPRVDGLTAGQVATLSSLRKVDEYPLYTMRYLRAPGSTGFSRASPGTTQVVATEPALACSLFAALGDPDNRLFGRNFDWRYSPALLLFADRPETGGYASVSMVDLTLFDFDDQVRDLTALTLAERRPLLDAFSWPFDGMNEAGVAVGMAAVPEADERRDPGKPAIGCLAIMREILDTAGSADEAVTILKGHNIAWQGGPPLHYLVADRSGRAALVEFYGGEIAVLPNPGPWHAVTNFTRSAVAGDAAGQCPRYDTLVRRLAVVGGELAPRGALDLLRAVAQSHSATQWSAVYGMSTGRVELVMGRSYGQVHTFQLGER